MTGTRSSDRSSARAPLEERESEAKAARRGSQQRSIVSSPGGDVGTLPAGVRRALAEQSPQLPGDVRLHTGRAAEIAAAAHHARAFTMGRDVYFGAGTSPSDLALLGHELAHVQQQRSAAPSSALPLVHAPSLERAADAAGHALAGALGSSVMASTAAVDAGAPAPAGVQRQPLPGSEPVPKSEIRFIAIKDKWQLMEVWIEDVLVARIALPAQGPPTVNLEARFGPTVQWNSDQMPMRMVEVGLQLSAGSRLQWVQEAKAEFEKKGMTPNLVKGKLPVFAQAAPPAAAKRGIAVVNAAHAPTAGAKGAPIEPKAVVAPVVSKEEQYLLDELKRLETLATRPGVSPAEFNQIYQEQRELMRKLQSAQRGLGSFVPETSPVQPAPPREPALRRQSMDPDTQSGNVLAEEIDAARKWVDAHPYTTAELEDLRQRLAIMEGALAERQKALLGARAMVKKLSDAQRSGNVAGNDGSLAGFAFTAGFIGSAMLQLRPAEFNRLKDQIAAEPFEFAMGSTLGLLEGAIGGLWDNISGLAELAWKLSMFHHLYEAGKEAQAWWNDPAKYAAEKAQSWKDAREMAAGLSDLITAMIKDPAFLTEHGYELGVLAGEHAADWFNDDFMARDAGDKGLTVGKVAGRVVIEIALLFLGPEEWIARGATAVGQGVRISGRLAKAIIELMEKVPGLARLMKLAPGFKAVREAAVAGKEISAGEKLIEGLQDVNKLKEVDQTIELGKEAKAARQLAEKERDAAKGASAAKEADTLRDTAKAPDAMPQNVRQLPPPKTPPTQSANKAGAEAKALQEGKLAQRRIGDPAPKTTPPPNAAAKPVPAEGEWVEEVGIDGATVTKKWVKKGGGGPHVDDLAPRASTGGKPPGASRGAPPPVIRYEPPSPVGRNPPTSIKPPTAGRAPSELEKELDVAISKNPKGTPDGDQLRYERYLREKKASGDNALDFDNWMERSRGGRQGGPAHQAIQNKLASEGFDTEVKFGDRFADAANSNEIHQIGGRNARGDPIARERDAILDIINSREYEGQKIIFHDKNTGAKITITEGGMPPKITDPRWRPR